MEVPIASKHASAAFLAAGANKGVSAARPHTPGRQNERACGLPIPYGMYSTHTVVGVGTFIIFGATPCKGTNSVKSKTSGLRQNPEGFPGTASVAQVFVVAPLA